jgi:hypothetical protein
VKDLPDGLAIFLSGPANLERSQPAASVSRITALHLIVIVFNLGRSLRFAQNNCLAGRLANCRGRRVRIKSVNISAKPITLTLPEIGLIAMTRGALGVDMGLLLSNALGKNERRSAGLALVAVGVLTTIPILMRLRNKMK